MQASSTSSADAPTVRRRLVDTLRRDLIGPFPEDADLAEERLKDLPSRWYLTGYLVPADEAPLAAPDDDDDSLKTLLGETTPDDETTDGAGITGAGDDETAADSPTVRRRIRPTSLGLTVLVPKGTRSVTAIVEWGDYRAEPPIAGSVLEKDGGGTDEERKAADEAVWVRVPRRRPVTVDLPATLAAAPRWMDFPVENSAAPQRAGGGLVVSAFAVPAVRRLAGGGFDEVVSVTVTVVNKRPVAARRFGDVSYAFQVRLTLEAEGGFLPAMDLTGYASDEEDLRLHDLHYRDVRAGAPAATPPSPGRRAPTGPSSGSGPTRCPRRRWRRSTRTTP